MLTNVFSFHINTAALKKIIYIGENVTEVNQLLHSYKYISTSLIVFRKAAWFAHTGKQDSESIDGCRQFPLN